MNIKEESKLKWFHVILIPSKDLSHGIAGCVHCLWKNLSGIVRQWSQSDWSFFPCCKLSGPEPRRQKMFWSVGCVSILSLLLPFFATLFVHLLLPLQSRGLLIMWWESVLKRNTHSHKACWSKLRCWLTRAPGFPSKPDAPCV